MELQASAILQNIQMKLAGNSSEYLEMVNDEMRNYVGRGFGYYKGVLDYNNIGDDNSVTHYYGEFRPELLEELDAICKLCVENDVELVVVNTPRPVFDVLAYGPEYYDFNFEHLNQEGADAFSQSFAEFEQYRKNNRDANGLFYDWQGYIRMVEE